MVCCLLMAVVSSCSKSDHNTEKGLAVALSLVQADRVNDVILWAFDANGVLRQEYNFESPKELTSKLLDIPSGKYTVVAASNLNESFAYTTSMGTTRIEELLITINNASSSPSHSHYGVATVDVATSGISYAHVSLTRSMAELSFTVTGVPTEVASAKLEVVNSTKGYYPGAARLHNETATVDFGQITPSNGRLEFETKRLLPTTSSATRSDDLKTMLRMTMVYTNGGILVFDIEAPALQNSGIYTPEITYATFRPGVVIGITPINGWVELPPINGEILNPTN